jgi:hypothetical protein
VNVLYNLGSGTPYTNSIDDVEVFALNQAPLPTGTLDEQRGPFTQTLDFKITKGFRFWGSTLGAYAWVLNAFNAHNALSVQGTGQYAPGFLDTQVGRAVAAQLRSEGIDPDHAYALGTQQADRFSFPRTVRFGLRMDF